LPEISRVKGYRIVMHWGADEHGPPHFHVCEGGRRLATVYLDTSEHVAYLRQQDEIALNAGEIRDVCDWADDRYAAIEACWERVARGEPPGEVDPPDGSEP